MNIDQVSRDLVSKHWGAVDFDKLIAAEMRKLQEETLDEAARECDGKALSADAAAADFDQSIDIILEHKDRARSARALAKRIRSLKKHPPTQPDAQTEQPMHMQNGLTLEQREWIRAEIACALESRPAAPTSERDPLITPDKLLHAWRDGQRALGIAVEDIPTLTEIHIAWNAARALTAAREHVENKADAPTVPGFDSQSAQPVQREGASAPSSREVVCETCGMGVSLHVVNSRLWRSGLCPMTQADFARREVEAQGKASAPPPTTGEREVPADDAGWPAWFPTFEELNTAARKAHMDRRIGVPSNVAIIDAVAGLIAQRSPLSPEAKGEGTVDK